MYAVYPRKCTCCVWGGVACADSPRSSAGERDKEPRQSIDDLFWSSHGVVCDDQEMELFYNEIDTNTNSLFFCDSVQCVLCHDRKDFRKIKLTIPIALPIKVWNVKTLKTTYNIMQTWFFIPVTAPYLEGKKCFASPQIPKYVQHITFTIVHHSETRQVSYLFLFFASERGTLPPPPPKKGHLNLCLLNRMIFDRTLCCQNMELFRHFASWIIILFLNNVSERGRNILFIFKMLLPHVLPTLYSSFWYLVLHEVDATPKMICLAMGVNSRGQVGHVPPPLPHRGDIISNAPAPMFFQKIRGTTRKNDFVRILYTLPWRWELNAHANVLFITSEYFTD